MEKHILIIIKFQLTIIFASIWYLWLPIFPYFIFIFPSYAPYIKIGYYILIGLCLLFVLFLLTYELEEKEWIVPRELSFMVDYLYSDDE